MVHSTAGSHQPRPASLNSRRSNSQFPYNRMILDMPFPGMERVANVIAGCRSDVVGSNKHVNESTSSEDIQQ